jgi:hypothetical protein
VGDALYRFSSINRKPIPQQIPSSLP